MDATESGTVVTIFSLVIESVEVCASRQLRVGKAHLNRWRDHKRVTENIHQRVEQTDRVKKWTCPVGVFVHDGEQYFLFKGSTARLYTCIEYERVCSQITTRMASSQIENFSMNHDRTFAGSLTCK